MKLAEALSIRKDLQTRISQLQQRIKNNVKVQEGDDPLENPVELMRELNDCLNQLGTLIWRINATNSATTDAAGRSLTKMMAERDALTLRVNTLRGIFDTASAGQSRYSQSEIKLVTTIDVKRLGKQLDEYAGALRQLDLEIQALSFTTDLIE